MVCNGCDSECSNFIVFSKWVPRHRLDEQGDRGKESVIAEHHFSQGFESLACSEVLIHVLSIAFRWSSFIYDRNQRISRYFTSQGGFYEVHCGLHDERAAQQPFQPVSRKRATRFRLAGWLHQGCPPQAQFQLSNLSLMKPVHCLHEGFRSVICCSCQHILIRSESFPEGLLMLRKFCLSLAHHCPLSSFEAATIAKYVPCPNVEMPVLGVSVMIGWCH